MRILKIDKVTLEPKEVPVWKLIIFSILVFILIFGINAYITNTITKYNTTTKIIRSTNVVYGECNTLDLRREFMFDKYKADDKEAFYYTIRSVASMLEVPHEWLIFMLWEESRFNIKAKNPVASATGIGQMTKAACKQAGVNYEMYKTGDVHYQLLSVGKYLKLKKDGFKSYGELYLYLYLPAYINKPNNFKIPQKYLDLNPGYAKYKTIGEFKAGVTEKFRQEKRKY
jgi:hypothetical protein